MTKHATHDVYIDMLSVEICPTCPFEECHDQAVDCRLMLAREARKKWVVTLPPPRPDGVMVRWECEVEM